MPDVIKHFVQRERCLHQIFLSPELLSSADGGALVRLIAGDLGGFEGPGLTYTPISYAHVSLSPNRACSCGPVPGT